MTIPAWVRPSRPQIAWVKARHCHCCGQPIPRHDLDTDRTYHSREMCSMACMRLVKGTQAERGKMRWTQEVRA